MSQVDFLNIIKESNFETKKMIFSLLREEIQKEIIGYIKNPIGEFEPALSPTHSYLPLRSFGISDNHYAENIEFIPFPDNKSLAQMLEDPVKFNEWCKKNLQTAFEKKKPSKQ